MAVNKKKPDISVFVYLGPSIKGVIQSGSIYRGTRESVLDALSFAISKYPKIAQFVIEDKDVTEIKSKIKTPGSGLNTSFRSLAGK